MSSLGLLSQMTPNWVAGHDRNDPHSLGGQKSEIKVLAGEAPCGSSEEATQACQWPWTSCPVQKHFDLCPA